MNDPSSSVQLTPFEFDRLEVRVIERDGEAWFVASDVLRALQLDRKAMERVDEDEKGVSSIHTPGGEQSVTVLNEPGLYALVLGSRKRAAKRFKRWVIHDVLPAIRRTGGYQIPAEQPDQARLTGELALLECFCTLNNPAPSSRVVLLEKIGKGHGLETAWLPGYVEDGPDAGLGALDTASATALLGEYGIRIGAAAFNQRLADMCILERRTRKSRTGPKGYWCVTDKGQAFGKNLTAPQSPRETQLHWYRDRFLDLLTLVGMEGAA